MSSADAAESGAAADAPTYTILVYGDNVEWRFEVPEQVVRSFKVFDDMMNYISEGQTEFHLPVLNPVTSYIKPQLRDLYAEALRFASELLEQRDQPWYTKTEQELNIEPHCPAVIMDFMRRLADAPATAELKDMHTHQAMERLVTLMLIYNHAHMDRALTVTYFLMANMLRNKEELSINQLFGINRTFTQEEREQVLAAHPYLRAQS